MTFPKALEVLKAGGPVSRIGLQNPKRVIRMVSGDGQPEKWQPYFVMETHYAKGIEREPYMLRTSDILADDWVDLRDRL